MKVENNKIIDCSSMDQGPVEFSVKSGITKFNKNLISNYSILKEEYNKTYKIFIRIYDFLVEEMKRYIEIKDNLFQNIKFGSAVTEIVSLKGK